MHASDHLTLKQLLQLLCTLPVGSVVRVFHADDGDEDGDSRSTHCRRHKTDRQTDGRTDSQTNIILLTGCRNIFTVLGPLQWHI